MDSSEPVVNTVAGEEAGASLPCVLVVTDSVHAKGELMAGISPQGIRLIASTDFTEAASLVQLEAPQLLVIDAGKKQDLALTLVKLARKSASHDELKILFIAEQNGESLVDECINLGASDFLLRPFYPSVFHAKIKTLRRTVEVFHEAQALLRVREREEEVAEQLFSNAVESNNAALDQIKIVKMPAELFSGDVLLSAFRPNGDINVLLGDFTGHGLTAAIGALPLSETFHAMTRKGYDGSDILSQINRKLNGILPSGMFLATSFITLSKEYGRVQVWNCGMPKVYVFSVDQQEPTFTVPSNDPPLGILKNFSPMPPVILPLNASDSILLASDGIEEARSPNGEMFGEERLIQSALKGMGVQGASQKIVADLETFMAGHPQDDDISMIEIPGRVEAPKAGLPVAMPALEPASVVHDDQGGWTWELVLRGESLRRINPVPVILSQLQEFEGPGEHWQHLFTILTELYVNALDHGVLGLDSSLKHSALGFAEYFEKRQAGLDALNSGEIHIRLTSECLENGGRIKVRIKDSGMGFDFVKWRKELQQKQAENPMLSGRGVLLVEELCESLEYNETGTRVEAVFAWASS